MTAPTQVGSCLHAALAEAWGMTEDEVRERLEQARDREEVRA